MTHVHKMMRSLRVIGGSQKAKEVALLLVVVVMVLVLKQVYLGISDPGSSPAKDVTIATDCHQRWLLGERKPGMYNIYPHGTWYPIKVFCGHSSESTFTVFQQRVFGNVSFERTFKEYKTGFGAPNADYWMGLDNLVKLTQIADQTLRIDLLDWQNNHKSITYSKFSINPEQECYQLNIGHHSGNVRDNLDHHNGQCFYTKDHPDKNKCAANQGAGWWYNYCSHALLNGVYFRSAKYASVHEYYDGIYWKDWHGLDYSLKFVAMSLTQQFERMNDFSNFNNTFGEFFRDHLRLR